MISRQPLLQAIKLKKLFGPKSVLEDISFSLYPGETLAVMGPSGSGKTTLLRILAGLEKPSQGRVMMKEENITDLAPERRDIGFVFQHYALFPHLSVYDNLAFPLRVRHFPKKAISERTIAALRAIDMVQFRSRKPTLLSGGEKQRVAIMRAVIFRPSILLLDEPFSALDHHLIEQMQAELSTLQKTLQIAIVLVTHDCPFAMSISDEILILNSGHAEQIGTPRRVFEQPESKFVAGFLGPINLIKGQLAEVCENGFGRVRLIQGVELEAVLNTQPYGQDITIAVRPSRVKVGLIGPPHALSGIVKSLKYHGNFVTAEISVSDDTSVRAELGAAEVTRLADLERVAVWWDKHDACILFK